ncbi:glycosyltransferase [Cohnella hongkongensis]|uniref:Glycosyltransferase n=1 Tax=Cohnella hongkongensis TaxID=178337 RepID=A0ABV9F8E6_9BACL
MKVAFLIQSLQLAGSEKVAFELIKHYRDKGVECALFTLFQSPDPEGRAHLLERLEQLDVRVVELNKRTGLLNAFLNLLKLNRAVSEFGPDIIHAHGCTPNMYAGLRNLIFRSVYTMTTIHNGGDDWPSFKDRLFERLSLYGVNRIVSVAEHVSSAYQKKFGSAKGKITVIENGVNTDKFAPVGPKEKLAIRLSLGIPKDTPVLLQVARLDPVKNQRFLVETASALKRRGIPFRLLFAGHLVDKAYADQVADDIRRWGLQDEVQLLGSREDVARLLQISDVFLFPSRYEASPLALLEAIFTGIPTISSDIPATRKLKPLSPDNYIVEESAERWAEQIIDVLDAGRQKETPPVRSLIHEFSFDRVAERYLSLCPGAVPAGSLAHGQRSEDGGEMPCMRPG